MSFSIGICDDMEIERSILQGKVEDFFLTKEIGIEIFTYSDGESLLEEERILDLLFLDIEMPGIGGIEAGKWYHRRCPECKIVLASGRADRMREALVVEPLCFIDKPYADAQLQKAIEEFLSTRVGYASMCLYDRRSKTEILQRNIKYVYAFESSAEFVVANGVLRKEISLKELEKELDDKLFFRIDRKYIINFRFIEEVKKNQLVIGERHFNISVRRMREFQEKYREYKLHYR